MFSKESNISMKVLYRLWTFMFDASNKIFQSIEK